MGLSIMPSPNFRSRRSSHWPAARRAHLNLQPECQVCGARELVEVHHVLPYHLFPDLELAAGNLITLCDPPGPTNHHLETGHLGNWLNWNPQVREDCERARRQLKKLQNDRAGEK